MVFTINLTEEQQAAVDAAIKFARHGVANRSSMTPDQLLFRIGGPAGCGKTTILREIIDAAKGQCAVVAYTGKAASVLRSKGVPGATTIHARIYRPQRNGDGGVEFVLRTADEMIADGVFFFIIDEASMVGTSLFRDLQSFKLPIIAVGDPGQLEPVGSSDINLMGTCDVVLETIHRQAEDSPIIELARKIRMGEEWASTQVKGAIVARGQERPIAWEAVDIVLCGYNQSRRRLNTQARRHFKKSGLVAVGERIICIRNDSQLGVFNGLCGIVEEVCEPASEAFPNKAKARVLWDGEDSAREFVLFFERGDDAPRGSRGSSVLVDYGYAITVHKAQGSEWRRVAVIDEQSRYWSAQRWRYTAVTRASESLVLVLP